MKVARPVRGGARGKGSNASPVAYPTGSCPFRSSLRNATVNGFTGKDRRRWSPSPRPCSGSSNRPATRPGAHENAPTPDGPPGRAQATRRPKAQAQRSVFPCLQRLQVANAPTRAIGAMWRTSVACALCSSECQRAISHQYSACVNIEQRSTA
jgi:hypothetical protein